MRACLPDVSRQAVYDILHALTDVGLLRRVQPSGSVARYETRVGDNHHHMVCRSCGAIADVDCVIGAAPCLSVSATNGFRLDGAEVIYWGQCPGCSPSDASDDIGDDSLMQPLPDDMLPPAPTHPPLLDAHPRPAPAPVEWVASTTTTANIPVNTPLKPSGIGTGGLATNVPSAGLVDHLPHLPG